ncbi:nitrite/sulfite reductase [Umboniibacter marinipuniceus]|uniref:Sulfite reductase (NADPH) hemoprotein beta-component n=1 Tax=Umboniibacter marinipuniceus TaxID=569599 RepID=A0A3M0A7D6_9GAMM|nr:nitrite/sulfite reductase [Umboniibacter marinipuniceus]RMA81061.1 sulfite reductase (NADPH) hemoprotein beta-component [Umboniibacter marinipuniceus]
MYVYKAFDQSVVDQRVSQFRDQTARYLAGELSEEAYLPLRLQNGLYIQRHAPMLRVAIPYGMINSQQLRRLADVSRRYDRSYVHVTTRQNIQLNWPQLEDVPDILAELAQVEMHAIQTSGNCIRNTTTDAFAGVARDEVADPRPLCELIRQWSTLHPEYAFLPRKFKIAVSGTESDRAAIRFHDIGLQLAHNSSGELGVEIFVGGGLGRTPIVGQSVFDWVPLSQLLNYLEAILTVYNLNGRRDNKYKARIKILVKAMGVEAFREAVLKQLPIVGSYEERHVANKLSELGGYFSEPNYERGLDELETQAKLFEQQKLDNNFALWLGRNVSQHRIDGYRAVTLSLKKPGTPPGDLSADQLNLVADLAEQYSFGEARMTHEQNIVLADVPANGLYALYQALLTAGFATPNINTMTDIICCPGGDFCALANAKSIPVAHDIQATFDNYDYLYDLGDLDLNISGCMNACGHHHIGDIGILGVDKKGKEFYQISLGGNAGYEAATIGKILGPSFAQEEITSVLQKLLNVFLEHRLEGERFAHTYHRIGHAPFKTAAYATTANTTTEAVTNA